MMGQPRDTFVHAEENRTLNWFEPVGPKGTYGE